LSIAKKAFCDYVILDVVCVESFLKGEQILGNYT
jgi:hypothetical protein